MLKYFKSVLKVPLYITENGVSLNDIVNVDGSRLDILFFITCRTVIRIVQSNTYSAVFNKFSKTPNRSAVAF